jgi:hypothetical protein
VQNVKGEVHIEDVGIGELDQFAPLWEPPRRHHTAFTFLLGSVGTCIPTVLMSRGIVGSRATYLCLFFWIAFALAAGIVFGAVSS